MTNSEGGRGQLPIFGTGPRDRPAGSTAGGTAEARGDAGQEGMLQLVLALADQMRELTATVADLQATQASRPSPGAGQAGAAGSGRREPEPRPWCWLRMSHTDKAERLSELADWVREVLMAWPAAQRAYTPCWSWHWDVVEDLSMLYLAWQTAYLWPGAGVREVADFLDRLLPSALVRASDRLKPCTHGHQPDGERRDDADLVDQAVNGLRRLPQLKGQGELV
ncbi:hypothetical protein ACIBH1_48695 [Nonomuraea sp. NPDC050663]|uniref:hypothetical protein n=1 Tax=Nonomuraea sp. NPDC050663 TaxID=3364370 RepID=UPI0037BC8FDA